MEDPHMNPFGSPRKAEEFAAAVSGRVSTADPSVAALVAVVDRIRSTPTDPSPEFRLDLRGRLMTAAETELLPAQRRPRAPRTAPARTPLRRRFGALAGAAVVAGSSVSLAAASADSLPGELLYPVKRAAEDVELLVRSDLAAEGHLQLEHAATRLDEVDALTRSDELGSAENTLLISATLEDFTSQAREGADDLIATFEQQEETSTIDELNGFALNAAEQLRSLAGVVPAGAGPEFADAADAVVELAARTSAACRSCAGVVDDKSLDALRSSVEDILADDDQATVSAQEPAATVVEPVGVGEREKPAPEPAGPRGDGDKNGSTGPSIQPEDQSPPQGAQDTGGEGGDPVDGDPVDGAPTVPGPPESPGDNGSADVPSLPTEDVPILLEPPLGQGSNPDEEAPGVPLDEPLDDLLP
jgi:hypothetical protein